MTQATTATRTDATEVDELLTEDWEKVAMVKERIANLEASLPGVLDLPLDYVAEINLADARVRRLERFTAAGSKS